MIKTLSRILKQDKEKFVPIIHSELSANEWTEYCFSFGVEGECTENIEYLKYGNIHPLSGAAALPSRRYLLWAKCN